MPTNYLQQTLQKINEFGDIIIHRMNVIIVNNKLPFGVKKCKLIGCVNPL